MRFVLSFALWIGFGPVWAADLCQQSAPFTLRQTLLKSFPDFRLPLVTDNLKEDCEYNLQHGGTGCISIAQGDFNGDGIIDFIIKLASRTGGSAKIVVALASKSTWEIHVLREWNDHRDRLYVATEKPGDFTRSPALDDHLENGEVDNLTCRNALPALGLTESSEAVYCLTAKGWRHVWVAN